jgi:hypothetical protein
MLREVVWIPVPSQKNLRSRFNRVVPQAFHNCGNYPQTFWVRCVFANLYGRLQLVPKFVVRFDKLSRAGSVPNAVKQPLASR